MLIYTSGPIRGHDPAKIFEAFDKASQRTWRLGAIPFNPWMASNTSCLPDDELIERECTAIELGHFSGLYALRGVSTSAGARSEMVSACQAGITIVHWHWTDAEIKRELGIQGDNHGFIERFTSASQ